MGENDKELWENFSEALKKEGVVTSIKNEGKEEIVFEFSNGDESWNASIRPRTSYIVGIDIVSYSARSAEGQLILTALLFYLIQSSIRHLRCIDWIQKTESSVLLIPTGDGALIVFDDLSCDNLSCDDPGCDDLCYAAALIYCVQMWVEDINRNLMGRGVSFSVNELQGFPITPIHCRYVLAKGITVPIRGLNNERNAVGPGLVKCARILAASKGAHFLVAADVMDDFNSQGGIDGVSQLGDPWHWSQSLHCALMPEKTVKKETVCFYNVFGKFSPVALMKKMGLSPADSKEAALYNIGSHDVSTIVG